MRVLLSGTSNSILAKGINFALANDPAVASFTNCSYGASGTVALGDHLRNIDFSQHDFCVLDYCVNEEVFIFQKNSTTYAAMNNLNAMIDAASKAGCQPIVMIFPTSTRANFSRPFEQAITDQLLSRNIPVFNFYAFAQNLMDHSDLPFKDLFLDPMHIRREIGRFMGEAALKYMRSVTDQTRPEAVASDLTYQPLRFVPQDAVTVQGDHELRQRETRLMCADLLRVSPGSTIEVPIAAPAEIIGLSCNAARSIGSLYHDTDEAFFQVPKSSLFVKKRGLTLGSLPVKAPLNVGAGTTVIQYDFKGETTELQPDPALELYGFILRATDVVSPVHIATCAKEPTALEEAVSSSEMATLVELLRATPAA